jgi:hypothetical protein
MSPDDRLPFRMQRRDGFCGYRTESFCDALRTDVVGRDQRDQPVDGSGFVCPGPDGCGCFGRISVAPVHAYQGPAELGLSVTSCVCPGRGRPAACVEDHQTGLPDHLSVGRRGLENERTQPVSSPTANPSFDHGSGFLERRNGCFAQAVHNLRVREQLVQGLRILRSWRAEAKPVRVEAELLPRRDVMSQAETLAGTCVRNLRRLQTLAWASVARVSPKRRVSSESATKGCLAPRLA